MAKRFVGRAPGQLDLMGGAAAWAGSLVLEATLHEGVWATVELRDDRRILIFSPEIDRAEFSLDELESDVQVRQLAATAPGSGWTAYILGAFFLLKLWYPERVIRGANLYIRSELPPGLSAGFPAAIEVAVLKASACLYGVDLAGVELATASQWVENTIAGSPCGAAEHIAAAAGEEGCVLPVICQPCVPQPLVRLPDDLRLWGVAWSGDTPHGADQESARVAAFLAYKMICDWEAVPPRLDEGNQIPRWTEPRWNGYLSNVTPSLFRSNYENRLPETVTGAEYLRNDQIHVDPFTTVRPELTYRVRACARFAVEESLRARLMLELIRAGAGFEEMGELMYQSHYGYIECGLGCETADHLVSLVCEEGPASGLYGAKITGSGASGVVAILGRNGAEGALERVLDRCAPLGNLTPYVFAGSSMGADRFGVMAVEE
jgi:galactokinase